MAFEPPPPEAWEQDIQLNSTYLDRKEELEGQNAVYLKNHPEIQQLMSDFLLHLLHRKPEDVFAEASDYFTGVSRKSTTHLEVAAHGNGGGDSVDAVSGGSVSGGSGEGAGVQGEAGGREEKQAEETSAGDGASS